jgi:anti-sigma B factor antagonist
MFIGEVMEPKEPGIKVENGLGVIFVTLNDVNLMEGWQIDKLKELLTPVIKKAKQEKLVLNFMNVQAVSSALLGLLLIVHKRMIEQKGTLEIWNPSQNIQKVFEITQLTKVFNIQKTKT